MIHQKEAKPEKTGGRKDLEGGFGEMEEKGR